MLLRVLAVSLLIGTSATALADEIVDRRYVIIPPAYPAPPPGFLPLPSSGSPLVLREPGIRDSGAPPDRPIWTPARTEVVVGIDSKGRITNVLEYTPGRFDR